MIGIYSFILKQQKNQQSCKQVTYTYKGFNTNKTDVSTYAVTHCLWQVTDESTCGSMLLETYLEPN